MQATRPRLFLIPELLKAAVSVQYWTVRSQYECVPKHLHITVKFPDDVAVIGLISDNNEVACLGISGREYGSNTVLSTQRGWGRWNNECVAHSD